MIIQRTLYQAFLYGKLKIIKVLIEIVIAIAVFFLGRCSSLVF